MSRIIGSVWERGHLANALLFPAEGAIPLVRALLLLDDLEPGALVALDPEEDRHRRVFVHDRLGQHPVTSY